MASNQQKLFITGGAGFIGSSLTDAALANGWKVCVFDDLSTGRAEFLNDASKDKNFEMIKGDIRELAQLETALKRTQPEWVVHFAANADVRLGTERPRRDLDYNTIGTWNVLEAMRGAGCRRILFSSTGSVYGEPEIFPTPENAPFPEQTSFYAASKLAGEALISAYCHGYQFQGFVYRFVSIMGPRYTHGHVFDFLKQLKQNPEQLKVLGNGLQLKSYLHIADLLPGLLLALDSEFKAGFDVCNIGHDEALTVKQSIAYITDQLGLTPELKFTGGERGWVGDSPRILLDTAKIKARGWRAKRSLEDCVRDTTKYLTTHGHLIDESIESDKQQ